MSFASMPVVDDRIPAPAPVNYRGSLAGAGAAAHRRCMCCCRHHALVSARPGLAFRLTFLLALALAAGTGVRSAAAEPAFRLIAYASGRTDFARIPAAKLTHVNYAFAL